MTNKLLWAIFEIECLVIHIGTILWLEIVLEFNGAQWIKEEIRESNFDIDFKTIL